MLLCAIPSHASSIRFERFDTQDGLSQMSIDDILQDKHGFLWIATQDGLNRYDGYQFKIYRSKFGDSTSLADNRIYDLFEDSKGTLWIGTGGGLHRYDRQLDRFERFQFDSQNVNSISGNIVMSITEDQQGHLWLASYLGGLTSYDLASGRFTRFNHKPGSGNTISSNKVVHLLADKDNTLWIATNGDGLNRFDLSSGKIDHFFHNSQDVNSISGNIVKHIAVSKHGKIWVSLLHDGVNEFDDKTQTFRKIDLKFESTTMTQMLLDRTGDQWISTSNNGLIRLSGRGQKQFHYRFDPVDSHSISSNRVTALYQDSSGIIWIGTGGGGLNKFNTAAAKFKHYKQGVSRNGLLNSTVWSLLEDHQGHVWVGTESSGVSRLNLRSEQLEHYSQLPQYADTFAGRNVLAIFQDSQHKLWFGFNSTGVASLDLATEEIRVYRQGLSNKPDETELVYDIRVDAFAEDKQGYLWIGTGGGLSQLDPERLLFNHYVHNPKDPMSLSSNIIQSLFVDRDNNLWIGHYNTGLDRFDAATGRFIHYRHDLNDNTSISNNTVMSITQTPDGYIWLATLAGLNRFNPQTGQFRHFREEHGLSNNTVMGVVQDKLGFLWLTTNNGLNRFDPRTETFVNFAFEDGIQNNEFSSGAYGATHSGLIMAGGINGFNIFNPIDIGKRNSPPSIAITDFLINNQKIEIGEKLMQNVNLVSNIQLSYQDKLFAFEFAALDFVNPLKNQYRYQLEGFDKHWLDIDAKHRRATFTNISPGKYRFRLTAANADNAWQTQERVIEIDILPPPWRTWWAYSLYVFVFFFLLILLLTLRYKKLMAEKRAAHILQASEEQLSLALWGSGDQLWDWDRSKQKIARKNVLVNFDFPFEQPLAMLDSQHLPIHPQDRAIFNQALEEHIRGNKSYFECRYRLLDRNQQWRWVMDRGKVVTRDPDGIPVRMTGTLQDIHEMHLVQDALQELNEDLERKVDGRTDALQKSLDHLKMAQRQIIEAGRMASLGTLVAGVAHEVNTPLGICITTISTQMDALSRLAERFENNNMTKASLGKYIEETAFSHELIDSNLLKAAELVQSFKQVAVDQTQDNQVDIVFSDYLRDILRTMRSNTERRNVSIKLDVSGDWIINTYPGAWWQLLTKLIDNSIAHGFESRQHGEIMISASLDNDNQLIMTYSDDGCGMNTHQLEQIYDPFFTTARHRDHIGLGMHVVYNLVTQKLGGTIEASSKPNQGTQFRIKVVYGG